MRPITDRLYRRLNPAQRTRQVFAIDGIAGLLSHTSIYPTAV